MFILLILELQTLSLEHPSDVIHASFRIRYIQDAFRMVADKFYKPEGAGPYP